MSTKYIIANISLPLMINDDGSYEVLSENIEIKFSNHVGELSIPKTNDKSSACSELSEMVSDILRVKQVSKNDDTIARVKNIVRKNITFRNQSSKRNPILKYTMKNKSTLT
jgi:hypothetical protein